MSAKKTIEVWVTVLEEGTDTIRRTDAIDLGDGKVELLPINYDPEDEIWEFPPPIQSSRLKKAKIFMAEMCCLLMLKHKK